MPQWVTDGWDWVTGHATVLSTVVTTLCTVAIAKFTWRLADISEIQGKLTERALVETRRAFISVRGYFSWYEPDIISGCYAWRFQAMWENAGDTPTKNFRYGVHCEVRNSPLPVGFDIEANAPEVGRGLLGPRVKNEGGISPLAPLSAVTAQDIFDAQNRRKFIYFYGWARYFDAFPNTKEHVTRFCYVISPTGNPFTFVPNDPANPLNFTNLQHSEGNCADDGCS